MRSLQRFRVLAIGALVLGAAPVGAQVRLAVGRTGLPFVEPGGGENKVWMQRGEVRLAVVGDELRTTQDFKLRYPGAPLEKGPVTVDIAVREEFYRSHEGGGQDVSETDARGFRSFGVWIDGRRIDTTTGEWKVNDKKDTASRRRHWSVTFKPSQVRSMRIASSAPLALEGGRSAVEFLAKDLGRWRDRPDLLEIYVRMPGHMEAHVAGLEPKPTDVSPNGIRWVYRKAAPHRDIYILMPSSYAHRRR